ncbi:nuclear transport factor 2 [Carpediemonas membranifera]|uniref:Nuclear transport factor 2 n=1 Tax=Carpediemonas membranifera TaxID=201153 RepID=A0A8J6DXC3_9EUKA|nr:nuclear transport factor 2 [Carpediemonas membranifera]|eukprot:KAG9389859.1 nuclear transport factor 2 [Carpediemonas membranifera]
MTSFLHIIKYSTGVRPRRCSSTQEDSVASFQRNRCRGINDIRNLLERLQTHKIQHDFQSMVFDFQPTFGDQVLLFVSGQMIVDGQTGQPSVFNDVFTLQHFNQPGQPDGWYIKNHIFKAFMC